MSKTGRRSSPQTGKWETKELGASQGRKNHSAVNPAPEKGIQAFLTCGFETGIVTLTLCTQGIDTLKTQAFSVNGKPVIVWNGLVFRAAPVFLPVIPVLVVAGANTGLGLAEGTAEFLPNSPSAISGFAILVHSQSGRADRITGRKCL